MTNRTANDGDVGISPRYVSIKIDVSATPEQAREVATAILTQADAIDGQRSIVTTEEEMTAATRAAVRAGMSNDERGYADQYARLWAAFNARTGGETS